MKIMWISNSPHVATGYGRQTKHICNYLSGQHPRALKTNPHTVYLLGFQNEGAPISMGNMIILPRFEDKWGSDAIPYWTEKLRPDVVISLYDVWVHNTLEELGKRHIWCPYVPVDSEPLPPRVEISLRQATTILPFSDFGEEVIRNVGFTNLFKIYHGVSNSVYKELDMDRQQLKKKLQIDKPIEDKFVYLSVANNQGPRKRFARLFEAFNQVKDEHPDSLLWCHTDPQQKGGNPLITIANMKGLTVNEDIIFSPNLKYGRPYSEEKLNMLYNLADVHTLATAGEGFGLPIIESMNAGCPNVMTDFSTAEQFIGDDERGYRASVRSMVTTPLGAKRALVDIGDMARGMSLYQEDTKLFKEHSKNAKKYAKRFDWTKILPLWDELLNMINKGEETYKVVDID